MLPSRRFSTKLLMATLQAVILLVAASFLMIRERRTSRIIFSEMEISLNGLSEGWKINRLHAQTPFQQPNEIPLSIVSEPYAHLPPDRPQPGPKILWGITSAYDFDMELRRRAVIRSSYLSYYKNNDHFVENPHRICSLADVLEQKVHFDRCQLVYTFVIGGNPNGPEEFVDPDASSIDYLVDPSTIKHAERDVTYLNIKENQFRGKMQTWFAYTSRLIKEGHAFDYVVKADSDTMLYPEEFFAEVNQSFPTNPTRVYAGVSVSRKHCGKKKDEHCNKMVSDYYMGGAAEILSADLVHHVASLPAEQRRQLEITNHEDISIGNFVLSHPDLVTKLELGKPWGYKVRRRRLWVPVLWRHDKKTKQPGKWLAKFILYEKEIRRRDPKFDNIMILPTSGFAEQVIKFAIKSACVRNRKTVVEYCAMGSFSGKTELYLSRLTTDIVAIDKVDGNSSLTFQIENVDMFRYPGVDGGADAETEELDEDAEDEAEDEEEETPEDKEGEDNPIEEAEMQPWSENVVIALRNPIDDNLKEWFRVVQPNAPVDEMKIQSKNEDALKQLKKSDVKNIYVIRLEHLWDDIQSLEKTLGNPNPINPADWPALTDPIINVMSNSVHGQVMSQHMCCHLQAEIVAYRDLLQMGQNLQTIESSLQASIQDIASMCGATAIADLEEHCKRTK
jgi:Galactosyltransferase